jgi:histidine triad (HIT) family protein
MTNDCVFCEIAAGRGRASIVYEDDLVIGFLDISPINLGHTLIIPRAHASSLAELDEATGRWLFTVAQRTAAAIRTTDLRCEGINLWLADGEAAFQDVFHVHLHVIPRFEGDGFRFAITDRPQPSRSDLDEIAAQIAAAHLTH